MRYIGGEIELSESSNKSILNNQKSGLFVDYIFYSSGRAALAEVLEQLKPQHPILIPSYLCESILQPFIEQNLDYEFYKVNEKLIINTENLKEKLENKTYSAIYFINFFGFYDKKFRKNYKNGVFGNIQLIEDCTHSALVPNVLGKQKYFGDFIFGSLRKTLPLSDGAFIFDEKKIFAKTPIERDNDFARLKYQGKTLRKIFLKNQALTEIEEIYLDLLARAEEVINKRVPRTLISENAFDILNQLDLSLIYQKRRENFIYLSQKLQESKAFKEKAYIIKEIDDFEIPYMMPIFIKSNNRNEIRSQLRGKGVFTSVIWANPEEVNSEEFSTSKMLSDHILCLPVDQRYNEKDMDAICYELINLLSNE